MKITLIRHGATAYNQEGRYLGRRDEPLCDLGIAQARALKALGLPRVDKLFVSPLRRCRQTAAILYPAMEQYVIEDFTELDFGLFEGKTHHELCGDESYNGWLASEGLNSIPGGEGREDLTERCQRAFLECVAPCGVKSAAIVAHSGVIMALISAFARPRRHFYDCYIKNCGSVQCHWDGSAKTFIIEGGDLK